MPIADAEKEYLDLIDEDGNVIDKMPRGEVHRRGLNNFMVINSFVKNKEGKLLFPRRTNKVSLYPLCLDIGVGGHVDSGEDYLSAFKREALEELSIDLDSVKYRLLGHCTPKRDNVSAYMNVYEIEYDGDIDFDKDEILELNWFTPKEFMEELEKGDKAKSDLPILIRKFYL